MISPGAFRRNQHEYEVDGCTILGIKVDRPVEAGEDAKDPVDMGELAVRDGNSVADAGGAQPLTLQHGIKDLPCRQATQGRRLLGEFLQGRLF